MVVVDASALVNVLLGGPRAVAIGERLVDPALALHAPHVIDLEVLSALRRLERKGAIAGPRAAEAIAVHESFRIERHPHRILVPRVWQLRRSVATHDAAYVALAEALDAPLLTCDARLAACSGHQARVELL